MSERFFAQFGREDAVELPVLELESADEVEVDGPFRRSGDTGDAPGPLSVSPLLETGDVPGFGLRVLRAEDVADEVVVAEIKRMECERPARARRRLVGDAWEPLARRLVAKSAKVVVVSVLFRIEVIKVKVLA